MCMASASNVLARCSVLDSETSLVDLLASGVAHDVHTEDAISLPARKA